MYGVSLVNPHRLDIVKETVKVGQSDSSDVDLMIIGRVGLADSASALRRVETRLNRPVSSTLYSREEFAAKRTSGHAFLQAVLDGKKLFILGDSHALAATIGEYK